MASNKKSKVIRKKGVYENLIGGGKLTPGGGICLVLPPELASFGTIQQKVARFGVRGTFRENSTEIFTVWSLWKFHKKFGLLGYCPSFFIG